MRASNRIAVSIPDQCWLGKPLDPCLAEYSVTGLTRRETRGSICKALLLNMVETQAGSVHGKQLWQGQNTEQSVKQAWVDDQRTVSRGLGREIIQGNEQ